MWGLSSGGSWALEHKLSSCGAWADVLRGMWDLLRPGIKPVSPELPSGFFTNEPPGEPGDLFYYLKFEPLTMPSKILSSLKIAKEN